MDSEDITNVMKGYDTVSFDIFDTLLMRPYVRPTDVFVHMEMNENAQGFSAERIDAEKRARRKIHPEITLDEIYEEIGPVFRDLKVVELEYEIQTLTCNPEMQKVYEYALNSRKRIVLISDMYLPSAFLKEVLECKGFKGYHELYVSGEHRKNKHSGELYHHVLSELNIGPNEILHIGDNRHSDHDVPERMGIRSIHYEKVIARYFKTNRRSKRFYSRKKDLERSVLVAMDSFKWIRDLAEGKNDPYWYRFAYRFGGPISSMFVNFIGSNMNDGTLLFIARDGYNLRKVFKIMFPDRESKYVYALRLYNIAFGNGGQDDRKYKRYIVDYFSNVPEVSAVLNGRELKVKDYDAILHENAELFERLRKEESETYEKYLINAVGDTEDIYIADVTTMKFSSQRLIQSTLGRDVFGFYYTMLSKNTEFKCKGYNRPRFHNWTNVNLSEFLMSSPEYPVIGLSSDGTPVYQTDNPDCEVYRISISDDVTRGNEDYARDIISVFGKRIPEVSHYTLCKWMESIVRFPTKQDREQIMKIQWASGPDHKRYMSAVLTPENILTYSMNKAGELLHRIRK